MSACFAVIVSYHPNLDRLKANVSSLRSQGFEIVVVDNASDTPPTSILEPSELILLDENKGIATALNVGTREAIARGAEWVLSLDQDTEVADNLLCEYEKRFGLADAGALCPKVIRKGEAETAREDALAVEEVERCPTAGFLVNAKAWEEAGSYDDWMFIDYVDYDMCMKLRLAGYKIYRINTTHIVQELGKLYVNPFFDKLGSLLRNRRLKNFARVYNHSPLRNYYFVRNSKFYMWKYEAYLDLKAEKDHVFRWEVKKLILEPKRFQNMKAIVKGLKDCKLKIRESESA